jgi:peroxiredoxin family protein
VALRAVFFVSEAGYEAAWQAASLGLTAAAMGEAVVFVFAFDALRALVSGRFGKPLSERERAEASRGDGLGAPTAASMLQDARGLGARLVACDTTVKLCGFTPGDLEQAGDLDEVMGLPQIWRLTEGARVLNF